MKIPLPKINSRGMTLLEVVVLVFVIAILAAMILPADTGRSKAPLVKCQNNLHQTGYGFLMYADDNGGTMSFTSNDHTFPQFQKLQKYLPNPDILVCPVDKTRLAARNFATLTDTNLSYFLNLDAATNNPTHTILAGDRYLQVNGQPVNSGLFYLTSNSNLSWNPNYHRSRGMLAFTDGHVEISTSNNLSSTIRIQPLATNRLSIP